MDLHAIPEDERLLDTLRWRLGLRGTKDGCRSGGCGACTVWVDGRSVLSCLTLAHELEGGSVQTIETIDSDPTGHRVVEAFEAEDAVQCGYCTPGFVMAIAGLLKERPHEPELSGVLENLEGNLCRCTGYAAIARAVERARRGAP